MSAAYVIELADASAGVAVRERAGFRFYAATRAFNRLDGRLFKTVRAIEHAVTGLDARA